MRAITPKAVQTHISCPCGWNEVDTEYLLMRWNELSKWGIKRKKCKKTGEPFLFNRIEIGTCTCKEGGQS